MRRLRSMRRRRVRGGADPLVENAEKRLKSSDFYTKYLSKAHEMVKKVPGYDEAKKAVEEAGSKAIKEGMKSLKS